MIRLIIILLLIILAIILSIRLLTSKMINGSAEAPRNNYWLKYPDIFKKVITQEYSAAYKLSDIKEQLPFGPKSLLSGRNIHIG